MTDKTFSAIKNALIEVLELDEEIKLSKETRLKEELGLDSLASLTLILKIEEILKDVNIDVDSLEPEHFETLGTLHSFLEQYAQLQII